MAKQMLFISKIEYIYDATGVKLQKKVTSGTTITTDYAEGRAYRKQPVAVFSEGASWRWEIYVSNHLQLFNPPEGYVEPVNASNYNLGFKYAFQYKDHLGNIRLSYKELNQNTGAISLSIVEENNYYPFGLKHKGYNGTVNGADYPYGFQDQEETNDPFGFNMIEFKYRMHDPAIGRFIQVDPLSEKYAHQSHYNFSENRVIDGRELEGLEVQLINPTKSASTEQQKVDDQRIVNGSKNIPNNSTMITVTGHGNPTGILNDFRGEKIGTAKQFNALLNRNSDDWKNKESGEGMTVVLYSCRTGANEKNKDGSNKADSFAQMISGSVEFEDVEIIAPDQRVYFRDDGPVGTYEAEYAGPNDEYKADAKDHSRSDKPGNWNVFKNGELIRSYRGDWKPTNNPSWRDTLIKEN